jgi:hypothetical protein
LIDGNEAQASSTGVWVDGSRISGEVLIDAGMDVKLYNHQGGVVRLVVGDQQPTIPPEEATRVPLAVGGLNHQPSGRWGKLQRQTENGLSHGGAARPMMVAPTSVGGGLVPVGQEMQELRQMIESLRRAIGEHEARCRQAEDSALTEIRALVQAQGEQIKALSADFNQRLDGIHDRDEAQDAQLKWVIRGMTIVLVIVAGISSGRPYSDDVIDRMMTLLPTLGAGVGAVALVPREGHRSGGRPDRKGRKLDDGA